MRYWIARIKYGGPADAIQYFVAKFVDWGQDLSQRTVGRQADLASDRPMVRGEYERRYNKHRTRRSLAGAAPWRVRSQPLEPDQIECLNVDRQDRLGGVIHEYRHAA